MLLRFVLCIFVRTELKLPSSKVKRVASVRFSRVGYVRLVKCYFNKKESGFLLFVCKKVIPLKGGSDDVKY